MGPTSARSAGRQVRCSSRLDAHGAARHRCPRAPWCAEASSKGKGVTGGVPVSAPSAAPPPVGAAGVGMVRGGVRYLDSSSRLSAALHWSAETDSGADDWLSGVSNHAEVLAPPCVHRGGGLGAATSQVVAWPSGSWLTPRVGATGQDGHQPRLAPTVGRRGRGAGVACLAGDAVVGGCCPVSSVIKPGMMSARATEPCQQGGGETSKQSGTQARCCRRAALCRCRTAATRSCIQQPPWTRHGSLQRVRTTPAQRAAHAVHTWDSVATGASVGRPAVAELGDK